MTTLFLEPNAGQPQDEATAREVDHQRHLDRLDQTPDKHLTESEVSEKIGLERERETIHGVAFEYVGAGSDSVKCCICHTIMDVTLVSRHAKGHGRRGGDEL